jgi:hypothetical protein
MSKFEHVRGAHLLILSHHVPHPESRMIPTITMTRSISSRRLCRHTKIHQVAIAKLAHATRGAEREPDWE